MQDFVIFRHILSHSGQMLGHFKLVLNCLGEVTSHFGEATVILETSGLLWTRFESLWTSFKSI